MRLNPPSIPREELCLWSRGVLVVNVLMEARNSGR